jgi:YVTN family beta-propeller protein
MRRWKLYKILTLALALGALGCHHASTATTVTISAVQPSPASVITNTRQLFSATVFGSSNTAITWTVTCATGVTAGTCGTIDSNGLYLAPKTVPTVTTNGTTTAAPTATITATAQADTTKTSSGTATIVTGISISITPTTATIGTTEHFTFTANVNNPGCDNSVTSNQCLVVTWSVPTTGTVGSIDPNSGLYTAPGTATTVTITATSVKDTTVIATASATIVTAADPTLTSVSPGTAAVGSLFQDIYITGTNFISTNNVFVTRGLQTTQLAAVGDTSSVIRARIPDSILAAPGVLQVSVARQAHTPVSCPSANLTPCQVVLIGVRPVIVGPSPDNIQQGTSGALSFNINGGFFGTSGNPSVSATYAGQLRTAQVTNARQMSVIIGGSNPSDFATPGLYPVAIQSTADATKFAVTNIAVQPNYSAGLSTISTKPTVVLPAGSAPSDVAVNPATGLAVVANTGKDSVSFIDITSNSTVPIKTICTASVGAMAPPCATPTAPKSVAIDYIRNIALVVNSTPQTVAVVDLSTMSVASVIQLFPTPPSDAAQHPPVAVGINPVSGRALVAIQNRPYGLLLTDAPPAVIGPVTISTGANSHIAVEPRLNWAIATPGGLGSIGIVDLNRQTVNNIASVSRTSNIVTVTVKLSTTADPQPPLAVQLNDTVLIKGVSVSDPTFPDGFYTVSGVGPSNGQFSYAQTGAAQPDKPSFTTPGTLNYAAAVAAIELTTSFQGIGINPETQQAVLVDPSSSGVVSFLSLLDQTSSPLTLRGSGNTIETGSVAGAFNPLTNVAVTVNPTTNTLSVIDPSTPTRLTSASPFPAGAGPAAVAVDPGTNLAVVANQANDSVSIVSLGAIQPLSITETSPKTFVASSTLSSPAAPSALTLTILGKGFTGNSVPRLDGIPLVPTFVSDRELTAIVPPSLLTLARRFALDVQDPSNGVSNATDFTVVQSVDVSDSASGCTTPLPAGVAIDPELNVAGVAAVSLSGCDKLALINLSTGVGATIKVGTNPLGVAVLPRLHKAIVVNNLSNSASVIDELGPTVTSSPTTGSNPVGVAADQDTGEAAVTNSQANTVSILSLATNGLSNTITTGQRPLAVAFDYQTHQIAVAADASNSVGIATASAGGLTTSFSISVPTSVAYDPATNDFLAASSTNNSVTIYDPTAQAQVGFLRVGINPTAIAYNYLTGTLVSTNTGSHTITVADILNNRIRALLTLPPPPANSTLAGSFQFAVDIHPLTNLAVIADTANGRVLLIPLPR